MSAANILKEFVDKKESLIEIMGKEKYIQELDILIDEIKKP